MVSMICAGRAVANHPPALGSLKPAASIRGTRAGQPHLRIPASRRLATGYLGA